MIKRVTWFVSGVAAGVAGAGYTKRKVKTTIKRRTQRLSSTTRSVRIASSAAASARAGAGAVIDAVREGRQAMVAKESQLRARRDMTTESITDHLEPGDQLLVDGTPVDLAKVVVLKPRPNGRDNRRFKRRTS